MSQCSPAAAASSDLVYATCSLLYADGGADLWFIHHDTMAACDGKLFKMLCKMGRDADVRQHMGAMPAAVLSRGFTAAVRHGRVHVMRTILDHASAKPDMDLMAPYQKKARNKPDPHGSLALKRAIQFGHTDLVHTLAARTPPVLTDAALNAGLVDAIRFKRRPILQALMRLPGAHAPDPDVVYQMWRMVALVGATELADLLPITGDREGLPQTMYERAAKDDNWALILLLHRQCKENVHINDAMLQSLIQSHGTVRHVAWLLEQPLPNVTLCLRRVLRRAIKLHDWRATETMLKSTRTPVFMDDMQWLCESLLRLREADQNMPLFRMALQRIGNPLHLVACALPQKVDSPMNATPSSTQGLAEPNSNLHTNSAALTAAVAATRRSHIFSDLDATRRAIMALSRHCPRHEAAMTSLLDLIGEDQDLLQPVITQLWSTLAKARAWSALTATLNWTCNSLARPAHPWKVSQDHHLTAALAAITQAGNAQDGSSPGASLVKVVRDVLQKMDNQ